jgi:hypothetical protein
MQQHLLPASCVYVRIYKILCKSYALPLTQSIFTFSATLRLEIAWELLRERYELGRVNSSSVMPARATWPLRRFSYAERNSVF